MLRLTQARLIGMYLHAILPNFFDTCKLFRPGLSSFEEIAN